MGWRDGGRLCVRRALPVGRATAKAFAADHRRRGDALFIVIRAINIYGDPSAVVTAEEHRLHGAFVFEYDEVSAVVAVSVDDAWSGDPRAGVV